MLAAVGMIVLGVLLVVIGWRGWHPRRRRYAQCLANITRLELELGFGEGPGQRPSFSPPQILASPYSFESSLAAIKARHEARAVAESKEENPALYAEMVKRGLR